MTWEQVGPLVGVVVGAALGGGAQVLNDWIGHRRLERQVRQNAAGQFMDAFYQATMAKQRVALTREGFFGDTDPDLAAKEATRSLGLHMMELYARRSHLLLIDDRQRISELSHALVTLVREETGGTMEDVYESPAGRLLAELVEQSRRI